MTGPDIADALTVPVAFFFEGLDSADAPPPREIDAQETRHLAFFRDLDPKTKAALETITQNLIAGESHAPQAA